MTTTRPEATTTDPTGPTVSTRLIALAAATASLLTLAVTRITHAAVGVDAIAYIAVANSIKDGNGIGFWLEDPLVTWPPLWPSLLAGGMELTGWRGDIVAVLINTGVVAGCVVLGIAVARRVLSSTPVLMVLAVSLAVSPYLVGLAAFVQTEVVFAMLAVGVIAAIMRAGEEAAPKWLVLAGLLTALGFYVRYQALYVVPVFAFWLVVRSLLQTRSPLRAITTAMWYGVPAVVPSAIWILRNLSVSDTALGPRFPSDLGPVANAEGALRTVFKFVTSIPTAPLAPSAALTLVLGVLAVVALVRTTRPPTGGPRYVERLLEAFCGWAGLLAVFVVGFTSLMVLSRSIVGFDDLDVRLLAPCLIPTSILFLRWVEIVLLDRERRRTAGKVVLGLWLLPQLLMTLALVGPANSIVADFGYNADRAVAASSSPAIDAMPADCVPFSNNAADLYRSGLETFISPRHVEYKSDEPTGDIEELVTRVDAGERLCLVWVEYIEDDEVVSVAELSEVVVLEQLASADDVTVYEIHPAR